MGVNLSQHWRVSLSQRYRHNEDQDQKQYLLMFKKLVESFKQIEFAPSAKGFFIERLRRKLDALSVSNSNEIVDGRISEIGDAIRRFYSDSNLK